MTHAVTLLLELEELEGPGVQVLHVVRFGDLEDLWVYRDTAGRWRSLAPALVLPGAWISDWTPPLGRVLDEVVRP